jgi:hypothetical protein
MLKKEFGLCQEKDIRIVKHKKESDFTTLYNDCINDEKLSAVALAVLVYVMSKPDDWKIMVSDLRRRFSLGRDKCYSTILALCGLGYMKRLKKRSKDGTICQWVIEASDKPIFLEKPINISKANKQPFPENQENPLPENPLPDLPDLDNQEVATIYTNKDFLQNKEKKQIQKAFPSEFAEFWIINPKKIEKLEAQDVFNKLLAEDYGNFQKIMNGRRAQNVVIEFMGTETQYIKGPVSWLKNKRFEDEVPTEEQLHEQRQRSIRAEGSRPSRMSKADIQYNINAQFRENAEREERNLRAKLAELNQRGTGSNGRYIEEASGPFDF